MADRDDRPKKSWREVDARRDRSSSGSGGSGGSGRSGGSDRGGSEADRASRQYRAALEALFDKGGVGKVADRLNASALAPTSTSTSTSPSTPATADSPAAPPRATAPVPAADAAKTTLRKKIVDAIGRDPITRAVDKYLKEHPLPEDYEVLEQVLEHRHDDRVRDALDLLDAMLAKEKPKRSRVLGAKLRFIEETSDDKELRARAASTRSRLA